MNYKVLYRKYRPTNFDNIVGQDYIIKTLKNSIINNNISHAYIFSGPRGTGKTSTAKVFAKAINCLNPVDGQPCDNCEFCRNFKENPDIIEMDAASNNGVDEIREIIDNVKLAPTNGKYKVYIIDEVHMLTTSAFNALLLTLEEPPSHIVFILATTNIENVPITILSRCQRFDFQKIKIDYLVNTLKNICEKENINIDDDALTEIAYLSEGGMRDALSLLDQLSKSNEKITLDYIENQIKIISQKSIDEIIQSLEDNNTEKFLTYIEEFKNRSVDYKSLIKKLIDNLSVKAKNIKKSGKYNRLQFLDYKNLIIKLSECLTKININVNPYIILEMIFLEFFDSNEIEVKKKKIIPEKNIKNETTSKQIFDKNIINIRINNCFVNAKKQCIEEAKSCLNKVIDTITNGKIKSMIMDSSVVAASEEYIILSCTSEHAADSANEIINDLENAINHKYKVIFVSNERWNKEKQSYINNIKSGYIYKYIEEDESTETSTEPIINDIFDMSKVEII